MKRLALCLICGLFTTLAGCDGLNGGGSNETENKLLGLWKGVRPGGLELSMEFTKDGDLIRRTSDDEEEVMEEGDYKLEGNTITVGAVGKKEGDTYTIKRLEGNELVLHDNQNKVEWQLKKVK